MEKDYCLKCGNCCRNIKIDLKRKILFFDGIQHLDENFLSMLEIIKTEDDISFCKCKFLENNSCSNLNKPEICKNYPSSPFAYIPRNCGFEGDVFMSLEHVKQKIRKLKEEIIHYEALINTSGKSEQNQYQKIINSHKKFIEKYKPYGSENW